MAWVVGQTEMYELRQATDADFDFVKAVKFEGLRPYVAAVWGWDEKFQQRRFAEHWKTDGLSIVVVDGARVGVLEVRPSDDCLFLAGIYIAAEQREKGLGGLIVQDVVERARSERMGVRLQVLRPNPARRLYERLGFVVTEETEERFAMEWRPAGTEVGFP